MMPLPARLKFGRFGLCGRVPVVAPGLACRLPGWVGPAGPVPGLVHLAVVHLAVVAGANIAGCLQLVCPVPLFQAVLVGPAVLVGLV